ncbi:MAG: hypothetical protein AAF355_03385 [Myxococcota bacterium]
MAAASASLRIKRCSVGVLGTRFVFLVKMGLLSLLASRAGIAQAPAGREHARQQNSDWPAGDSQTSQPGSPARNESGPEVSPESAIELPIAPSLASIALPLESVAPPLAYEHPPDVPALRDRLLRLRQQTASGELQAGASSSETLRDSGETLGDSGETLRDSRERTDSREQAGPNSIEGILKHAERALQTAEDVQNSAAVRHRALRIAWAALLLADNKQDRLRAEKHLEEVRHALRSVRDRAALQQSRLEAVQRAQQAAPEFSESPEPRPTPGRRSVRP